MSQKIMVVLADGFEEIEAVTPMDIWSRLGLEVVTVALGAERIVTGAHRMRMVADTTLDAAEATEFAAIFLPGGMPGTAHLFASAALEALLRQMAADGKVTAAICAAPAVLGRAGLLRDGKFTMFPDEALRARFVPALHPAGAAVVVDGGVVTGNGPGAAVPFAGAVAAALGVAPAAIRENLTRMQFA